MKRNKLFKFISILIGTFLGLVLLEVFYRAYHSMTFEHTEQLKVDKGISIKDTTTEKTLGEVIYLSNNSKIIYELLPNSIFRFQGEVVKTNKHGFRDKDYPIKKEQNTIRVIGLGDSVMFGWGIAEGKNYMDQLEKKLNHAYEKGYEVINTAVPGYNTVMEVEVLKDKLEITEVDIVILNFVSNDFDLPNFIRKQPNYFGLKKSMILQSFVHDLKIDQRLGDAPFDVEHGRYERDWRNVPKAYRTLVGEESCKQALFELKELSEAYGFKVLFLSHSPYFEVPKAIRKLVEELAFKNVDIKPYWEKKKLKDNTLRWQISADDYHPSLVGHTLISAILYEKIREIIEED